MDNFAFYWSKSLRNQYNEPLSVCAEKYGTETHLHADGFYYNVVYLDEKKNPENSWLLWAKELSTDQYIPIQMHEEDPDTEAIYINESVPVA